MIVGRSNIVGKPMAQLLLAQNATVTIAHSRTKNLPDGRAARRHSGGGGGPPGNDPGRLDQAGRAGDRRRHQPHPRRGPERQGQPKTRLVGDVAFQEALDVAGAITPVPGGVGPMTIAMLMANTLRAAKRSLPA